MIKTKAQNDSIVTIVTDYTIAVFTIAVPTLLLCLSVAWVCLYELNIR